jgi:iron complex outermembrane receptor protein
MSSNFWQLQGGVDYKSKMATDDRNQQYAPASTLWRLQSNWHGELLGGTWHSWLAGENIGNARYVGAVVVNQNNGRSFEPGLPRQWLAGFQFSYQLN